MTSLTEAAENREVSKNQAMMIVALCGLKRAKVASEASGREHIKFWGNLWLKI